MRYGPAQAPLQVYAKMLRDKGRRQRALQGAGEVHTREAAAEGDEAEGMQEGDDGAAEDGIDVLQRLDEAKAERREGPKEGQGGSQGAAVQRASGETV